MRIIAGPCQHENLEHSRKILSGCKKSVESHGFEYIFKASYDKANRSSDKGIRGVGLEKTLEDFAKLKEEFGNRILTDVHSVEDIKRIQSSKYSDAVDILQIPAFLCRQTDLVKAASETGKVVNIKKGQFLAPWDVEGILSKIPPWTEVWITERGTSFGYNRLVVDFTGVDYMLRNYSAPIVMDCTHAVQLPGGLGSHSGGNRDYAPGMGYAAAALGVENFFLEVHDDPDNAPSDGPNMIRLEDFSTVVEKLNKICRL